MPPLRAARRPGSPPSSASSYSLEALIAASSLLLLEPRHAVHQDRVVDIGSRDLRARTEGVQQIPPKAAPQIGAGHLAGQVDGHGRVRDGDARLHAGEILKEERA